MSENKQIRNFENQTQPLTTLVRQGKEIVSGVNDLFEFTNNINSLLEELHGNNGLAARYSKPRHKPSYIMALTYKALAYYLSPSEIEKENFKEAAKCIKEAIKFTSKDSPENIELYYQLAQYSALSEDKETTLDSINRIIRIDPGYVNNILGTIKGLNVY